MDTHGLTWTNTFSHARLGMTETPRSQLLPGVFGGPCQGCQIVYVGPCGSMAEKVFYVGCIICLYFQLVILSQKLEGFISTGQPKEKQTELPIHFP